MLTTITAAICLCTSAIAQDTDLLAGCTTPLDELVTISTEFDNTEISYTLIKERWLTRQGQTTHVTVEFEVDIETAWREDGLEIRWNQRMTKGPPELNDPNNPASRLSAIWAEYELVTTLDENGVLGDVANLDEITAKANQMIGEIEGMLHGVAPPQQVATIVSNARAGLRPEVLQPSLLADLSRLLVPTGCTVDAGTPFRWEEPVILPVGGAIIDAQMELSAVGVDDEGRLGLRQRRTVDEAEVRAAVEKTLTEMAASLGQELPPGFQMPELTLEYRGDYLQDLSSPWPVAATIVDETGVRGQQGRREQWRWTRVN